MVLEKSNVFFYDALLCVRTCLMDVALVRGLGGVYDVCNAVCNALRNMDGEVKSCGVDIEREWYIVWNGYGCQLSDGRVGDDVMYVRVSCRCCGGFCLFDVYATLPDGLYDLNLKIFEK